MVQRFNLKCIKCLLCVRHYDVPWGQIMQGVQELDTNSLILKSRRETTRKLKYRVRECLGQLLHGGDTVRGEGARARRGKLVSY